jgi:hypothetical protein
MGAGAEAVMAIDPKVREAFEWRGVDSVRALLSHTGSGPGAAITLGPGFDVNRSDAEEWLREKDGSNRSWLKTNTAAAIIGAIAAGVAVVFTVQMFFR